MLCVETSSPHHFTHVLFVNHKVLRVVDVVGFRVFHPNPERFGCVAVHFVVPPEGTNENFLKGFKREVLDQFLLFEKNHKQVESKMRYSSSSNTTAHC